MLIGSKQGMKYFLAIIIISVSLILTSAATAATSTSRYADFKNWTAACDNTGHCQAIGFNDEEAGLIMYIDRAAGPNGDLSIRMQGSIQLPLDKFFSDDKKITLAPKDWKSINTQDEHTVSTDNSLAALSLINTIRNAKRIGFGSSKTANSLSLDGLSASLLLIDEVQGRLGSQNAFIRKGNKPESAVPAAHPVPKLKAMKYTGNEITESQSSTISKSIRKQFAALLKTEECNDFEDVNFDNANMLSANEAIALIECTRGAYQSYFLAFRVPIRDVKKATAIAFPMQPGKPSESAIGNAEYDPKTGVLSSYGKGRGLFDCGETTDWVFDGKRFVLANYTFLNRCGGVNPGEFPTLWRSEIE
jgi:Protein of unknown function (DUF1176)